jgi:hypothetical protein
MSTLEHVLDVQEIPNQLEDWHELEEQFLHTLG